MAKESSFAAGINLAEMHRKVYNFNGLYVKTIIQNPWLVDIDLMAEKAVIMRVPNY
jgi:hypothetical protein